MKFLNALIGTVLVALFTTAAVAGDETMHKDSTKAAAKFQKMDKDKDGKLSKSEVKNDDTLTAQFAAVDQDSDGYVSETEYTAMLSEPSHSQPSQTQRPSSDYNR
jgi:Ca2+-binding EF-hand superfamily protein